MFSKSQCLAVDLVIHLCWNAPMYGDGTLSTLPTRTTRFFRTKHTLAVIGILVTVLVRVSGFLP